MSEDNMDELTTCQLVIEGVEEAAEAEERHAGAGSYGYVFKVTVGGVQRIAKKLHSNFTNPSQVSAVERESITSKFRNECVILSKLRHPNIVQFIGVHYGRRGKADLTLIMECVSSDMDKFLDPKVHSNIPLPLKLSILLDVSYGLVYLHECNPPIVHRDLTARNILITDKCQAKIADLGVAKVVDIHTQMATAHTQVPGNVYYMPPEALVEKASCTPKLDIFSFGHLTLYTVNQEFPKAYRVRVTSEMEKQGIVERLSRQTSLNHVGRDHCLYPIITECLFDEPEDRPSTRELNSRLLHLITQYPTSMEDVMKLMGKVPRQVELMQQLSQKEQLVEQYKKQVDHRDMELTTFKDAHKIQKAQIQDMAMKINFLRGENTNLKARERHYEATGKTGAALEVEKQRVHELEGSVEELQMTNAILQSKVEQYQKQVQPSHFDIPISPSSSRDRVGQQNFSAPPSHPPHLALQGKASSVDSVGNSRGRQYCDDRATQPTLDSILRNYGQSGSSGPFQSPDHKNDPLHLKGSSRAAFLFSHQKNDLQGTHGQGARASAGYRSSKNGPRLILRTPASYGSGHAYPRYPVLPASLSDAPPLSPSEMNPLELGVDGEIFLEEDAPYDPNLVCPTCGQGFRIGKIQQFREHAASCNMYS